MGFVKQKDRKKQRYSNILLKKFGIHVLSEPSQTVAVCNGGLANGLTQDQLIEKFGKFGVLKLYLPPGESVSFLHFESVKAATLAYESPKAVSWEGGGPPFLAFIDRLPNHDDPSLMFETPPGLLIFKNFITEEEESRFLERLSMETAALTLKNRVVKHFGFEFRYSDNRANSEPIEAIPDEFNLLWPRLLETSGIEFHPDQCTANRYAPGDGIPSHVDTHSAFTEAILSLSLQSDVVMDWRKDNSLRHVLLPRRSLCVMTGESRYGWRHGITSRKSDVVQDETGGLTLLPRSVRTSLTFRKRQEGDCHCIYTDLCDSALRKIEDMAKGVPESLAAKFEETCVHQVYEEIAEHFSETRHKPWPNVVNFLNSFAIGSLILDVGCGNGKYLGYRQNAAMLGCDRSTTLSQLCSARGYPVFVCDCLQVSVKDCSMDGVISIAVLHHLSTEDRRLLGIQEIVRVLRPGGRALIYVWAKNQEADSVKSSYLRQRKERKQQSQEDTEPSLAKAGDVVLPVHTNRTNFQSADMFVPWQKKRAVGVESGPTFLRFYHVFEDSELKDMCEAIEGISVLDYYYDQGNWCIILEKLTSNLTNEY